MNESDQKLLCKIFENINEINSHFVPPKDKLA